MIQEQIVNKIKEILGSEIALEEIKLVRPTDSSHGDFTTSIALIASKKLGKKPTEIAENLKNELGKLEGVEKIEVAGPGFINFFVAKDNLLDNISQILSSGDSFGTSENLASKKIMLEFADPNPFKIFHIGHLRNIALGETFARLLEAQGGQVMRVNYQGDVGMHVAKAIWGINHSDTKISDLENKSSKEKAEFLGKAYALGAKAYEDSEDSKAEIRQLNVKIYKKDPDLQEVWEKGKSWSLSHFEEIYKRVGTLYERFYFESEVAEIGKKLVLENVDNGIFEKSEGAIVFHGDHTRVFVTKEDYATYEAKDLALAKIKYQDFEYSRSIIITAHEQASYFKVVLEAMKKLEPELAGKTEHYTFGFVSLKDEKMSSRLGNIIAGDWLLDEAKKKISENFKEMDEKTLEMVAVGAVKYSMLKFSRVSDISFSFDESISLEGNSGPYIQYTFARTQSVLAKKPANSNLGTADLEPEELELVRMLAKFSEVIEEAGNNFSPNLLCIYLFELSQKFNLFYQKHKIIGGEKEEFRLSLTKAVGQVIKNGLYLLGIESPEKM